MKLPGWLFIIGTLSSYGSSEIETNDTSISANPIFTGQAMTGQLSSVSDQDWFSLSMGSAGTVTVLFDSPLNSTFGYYTIQVRNAVGTLFASVDAGADTTFQIGLPSAGAYFLIVRDGPHSVLTTNQYSVTLSGTLPASEIAVEQAAIGNIPDGGSQHFGNVLLGGSTSLTFTIRNTGVGELTGLVATVDGAHAADFAVTSSPSAPVNGPNGTTTFSIQFAPTSPGPKTAALHIASNDADENPFDINLTGTSPTPVPEISVEQAAVGTISDGGSRSFGSVPVGSSQNVSFTIRNTGAGELTGLTTTIDGADAASFTVVSSPGAPVSGPNGTTSFTVRFAPLSAGAKAAILHIANNDADENPFDISLTGTTPAPVPEIAFEESDTGINIPDGGFQSFGSVVVGGSANVTFVIRNTGNASLTGLGPILNGPDALSFSLLSSPTAPVSGPNGATTFTVRFAPTSPGAKTAGLHIGSNDPDESPFDINFTGTGLAVAPEIGVVVGAGTIADGGNHGFGTVLLGNDTSFSFTINNTGSASLTGLATTIDGADAAAFAVTVQPTAPVPASGGTTFTVRFAPTSIGGKTAALHIASNDADENPFDIVLTGTGLSNDVAPAITSQPASQVVNQGAQVSFSVEVSGTSPSLQWRKDGVDIAGAVGKTLVIASAQPWQIGDYSVRATNGGGSAVSDPASLDLTDVPSGLWRGLVACYPFDGSPQDICRPGKAANLVSTSALITDPQRGGVVHIQGKGFGVPALPGEPVAEQGPGGYIRIPRPPLGGGEPFTVSFLIKEEGFSMWHGESFVTMGEGGPSIDLIGHYWIGSLDGTEENYGGNNVTVVSHDSAYVLSGWAVALDAQWTSYTVVAGGDIVRFYHNGEFKGTTPYKKDTAGDFFLGRHWWDNGATYSTRLLASVDELRIYNRALSTSEIQQLHSLSQTTPQRNPFESWAASYGLNGAEAALPADPDHDGFSNEEEYPFGTSPVDATESLVNAVLAGTALTLDWLGRDGVRYRLMENPELVPPWVAGVQVPALAANQVGVPGGYARMQVSIPVPPSGPGDSLRKRFFRIEATNGPLIQGGGQVMTQPVSGEVVIGQSASFAVAAVGDGLSYQWFKNDLSIPGATSAGYVIATAQPGDIGNYSVVVTNAGGSATSQRAFFLVTEPPGFAKVHAATFTLGSPVGEAGRFADEGPQSTVTLSKGFYLKDTEVTWGEWNAVRGQAAMNGYTDLALGRNGNTGDGSGAHPVTEVSWWDAIKWCNLRSQLEGRTPVYYTGAGFGAANILKVGTPTVYADWSAQGYRLPTEAEWECACRAGTTGPNYAALEAAGWYGGNSGSNTHPVGQKLANAWGLNDTHGNVWEWCWDWKGAYTSEAKTDPRGAASGSDRVIRGGSFQDGAQTCRSAFRNVGGFPGGRYAFLGFRPVLNLVPTAATEKPAIVTQPVGPTVFEGQPASVAVTATGGGLAYQWYKNGSLIPGATARVFAITAAGVGDAGSYSVVVSNPAGSAPSQSVSLVVLAVPLVGFASVAQGSFILGSPAAEPGRFEEEGPQSTVTISRSFWLKQTEVTWAEWNAVRDQAVAYGYTDIAVGRNGNNGDASGSHPVTEVSWWDVIKWCNLKSQRSNKTPVYYTAAGFGAANILKVGTPTVYADWAARGYRLPTEAEWEFACRAGTTGAYYANLTSAGWYYDNSANNTHPVGQKVANAWGLKDLHGGVWEWCWDWLDNYTAAAKTDPRGAAVGPSRILRGGSWAASPQSCRSANRGNDFPDSRINDLGFRPAFDAGP